MKVVFKEKTIELAEPKSVYDAAAEAELISRAVLGAEVNGELSVIEPTIRDAVSLLKPGGRLAIITFHSLEDRIVKQTFASLASGCTCPRDFPVCVCGKKPLVDIISRKPILPSEQELEVNPRSRSAKLRVAQKR